MKRMMYSLVSLAFCVNALATTWAPTTLKDPISDKEVPANEIMSYGGYIYSWPSKFDLVFWPLTDPQWICFNAANGNAAFNDDFEILTDTEKQRLSAWLREHYNRRKTPSSHKDRLLWLQQVYAQRDKDDDFWCRFYRLMCFMFQDEPTRSTDYMKKAMVLLEKKLAGDPAGMERIEVLFLIGEYSRRLGERAKAKDYFAQVRKTKVKDEEGKESDGHPYFEELISEIEKRDEEASNKPLQGTEGKAPSSSTEQEARRP